MPSLKFNIIVDDKGGRVAMKQFAGETDAAFKRARASINRVSLSALPKHEQAVVKVERKYQSLNSQIKKLSKSGRISDKMAADFHKNIGVKMTDDLKKLERQGEKSFKVLGNAAKLAGAAIVASIGVGFKNINIEGLKAVEDYKIKMASLTAFMTTFSQKTAMGDIVNGFQEANNYAGRLIISLEKIDAKTVATGKDLGVMAETMMQNGVLLDIDNQKQVEGFTRIANALKLVTAGQNQDIQMRQEINALLKGQIRAIDRLPKLLSAVDPKLQEHLRLWREQGTTIEEVGKLLAGFGASTDLIEETWTAVGSSLETIQTRILRDGFKPIYEDLLMIANSIRDSLVDSSGELTKLANGMKNFISLAYQAAKDVGSRQIFPLRAAREIYNQTFDVGKQQGFVDSFKSLFLDGFSQDPTAGFGADMGALAPMMAPMEVHAAKMEDSAKKRLQLIKDQAEAKKQLNRQWAIETAYVDQIIAGEETLTTAVMTESEKSIYSIKEKYAGYERLIQQQVEAGNQTEAWAKKTHDAIGVRMQEDLDALKEKGINVADEMKDAFVGWANGMSGSLTDMVWSAELSFGAILESFGKMLTQMVIQYQIVQPMMQGLMGLFGGGGVTGSAGMTAGVDIGIAHAAGGYDVPKGMNPVTQLHEREMVLPAEYADVIRGGGLGGGTTNVIINNNSSKSQAQATEVKNVDGGKDIIVMIEDVVGNSIMSGRGKINKAMRSTFGMSQLVVGR